MRIIYEALGAAKKVTKQGFQNALRHANDEGLKGCTLMKVVYQEDKGLIAEMHFAESSAEIESMKPKPVKPWEAKP